MLQQQNQQQQEEEEQQQQKVPEKLHKGTKKLFSNEETKIESTKQQQKQQEQEASITTGTEKIEANILRNVATISKCNPKSERITAAYASFVPKISEIHHKEQNQLKQKKFIIENSKKMLQQQEIIFNNNKKSKTENLLLPPTKSTKLKKITSVVTVVNSNSNNNNNNNNNFNTKIYKEYNKRDNVISNNNHQQQKEQQQQHQQEEEEKENIKKLQEEQKPNVKKKTIDFNSRRRRGRLRYDELAMEQMKAMTAFASAFAVNCYNNIVPAICNRIRLATLLKQQYAIGNVAHHIMLLLSLLLTFIVDYVNSIKFLVISLNASCCGAHIRKQHNSNTSNINTNNTKHNKSTNNKNETKNPNSINSNHNRKLNLKPNTKLEPISLKPSRYAATNNIRHSNSANTSRFCSNISPSTSSSSSSNIRLIYALLICVTIILLPCSNNVANAAKPKSATQLQKQHQETQQNHQAQEPHLPTQHVAGVAFDSHGNGVLTPPSYQVVSSQTSNEDAEFLFPSSLSEEHLFDEDREQEQLNLNNVGDENESEENHYDNETHFDNVTITKTPLFPKDLFTKEQLERGAVIFHIIGVIYMFVALAIVCDEFFVPSLDVIIEKLGITDDVAGATFMAAGGSAPELFTSVIGVFVSFDDVGIGTIVGSAVFNILFVIGMCAIFSRTVLSLTWWPLFRDCSFYSISLMVLIYFFRDNRIYWWEALILFCIYMAYVAFMKWNVQVERCVKKVITKNKVTRVRSTDQLMPAGNAANSSETSMATQPGGSVTSRAASETRSGPPGSSSGAGATGNSSGTAGSTQTGAKFRHGLLQLMIHTIDPLHDDDVPGKVDEKATQLHAIASLKVLLDATKPQRGGATTSAANHVKINLKETTLADRPNGNIDTTLDSPSLSGRRPSWIEQRVKIQTRKFSIKTNEIEDEPEPLSMAWPDTARKRLTYILVAPLLIPMWLTLPDTRTPRGKKYFPVTFIGSILWIAAFSYLMVWWANVAGDTARIPPEVMGLTFLAAGTSIPDLITSVIVARKGFGDMAVSSSVGSNIFDVTVGLPIPWLLYGLIYNAPVEVNSVGMVCSITILFMMLIFVVLSIACFRWRMNKGLGFTMFLLYFVFVAVSLMFEYDLIRCPV